MKRSAGCMTIKKPDREKLRSLHCAGKGIHHQLRKFFVYD